MKESAPPSPEIPYRAELLRKTLHLLALVIPVCMYALGKSVALYILIPFSLIAIALEYLRVRTAVVARYVELIFGRMMRPGERPGLGGPMVINGATWVLLSATGLALLFPIKIASVSLGVFMVCDAGAALVGRRFGAHHWWRSKKTVEGSLAFFILALASFWALQRLAIFEVPLQTRLGVALTATLLEILPVRVNDNMFVPFCIAGLLYLMGPYPA